MCCIIGIMEVNNGEKLKNKVNPKWRIYYDYKLMLWCFGFNKLSSGLRKDDIEHC